MNNIDRKYILPGTIWSVKSYNEYDENYLGMTCGQHEILVLNNDINSGMISYVKIGRDRKPHKTITLSNKTYNKSYNIRITGVYLGDKNCLDRLIDEIPKDSLLALKNLIISIFLPNNDYGEEITKEEINKEDETPTENNQIKLFKYGIDVYITPNKDVNIDSNNKIILSEVAKDDFIYRGTTKEDRLKLCEKYLIYPEKAIREIRNRLIYRHKQKEG